MQGRATGDREQSARGGQQGGRTWPLRRRRESRSPASQAFDRQRKVRKRNGAKDRRGGREDDIACFRLAQGCRLSACSRRAGAARRWEQLLEFAWPREEYSTPDNGGWR